MSGTKVKKKEPKIVFRFFFGRVKVGAKDKSNGAKINTLVGRQ